MSIFNQDKSKNPKQNISADDYDIRLEERKEEYNRLNDILRGMRSEVSKLMDEIKKLTDDLVKKNAEKYLLEEKIEDLNRNYELLEQNIKYEQENLDKLTKELEEIKNELKENLIYSDKLKEIKSEYHTVSEQLSIERLDLEKINDEELNQLRSIEKTIENKKKNICKALTKSGVHCKRQAIEDSHYCYIHTSKSFRKNKR
jgi:chromosome segregation ATPase